MDQIIGQSRAIDVLQSALQHGRLHHALIFHGPVGVGKFTAALALARLVLCHDPQADLTGALAACGGCESCRLLRPGSPQSHPDLHVISKELALYSDEREVRERKLITIPTQVLARHLLEPVGRAAALRHGKVFIIDEAELLNPAGQNLLLKTLEEPPPGTHVVLVTSSEDRLLPTIRSRSLRVAFLPLPDEAVRDWLSRREADLTDARREWLVSFAAGSLGRASLALEYGLATWAEQVLPAIDQMTRGQYPVGLGAGIASTIDGFAKAWVDAHANASKDAANKLGAGLMWAMITQHARRRLAEAAGRAPAGPETLDEAEAALRPWIGVIEAVHAAEGELAANVNMGLVTDHLVSVMFRALEPTAERV